MHAYNGGRRILQRKSLSATSRGDKKPRRNNSGELERHGKDIFHLTMGELQRFILNNEPQFKGARLASLYSDFRYLRTTNYDGYLANISAWRVALTNAGREGYLPGSGGQPDLLVLHTNEELLRALETEQCGRPLALGTVIKVSVQRREIISLRDFMVRAESVHHKSWSYKPWELISWGLKQLGLGVGTFGEDKLVVEKFVLLRNVEECADNILEKVSKLDKVDRIFSRDMFRSEFAESLNARCPLTDLDTEVMLKYLARDKGAVLYNGELVKFVVPSEKVTRITTEDGAIASLRSLITGQSTQVSVLSTRIDELSLRAQKAVTNKNRASALAALRSRKLAEAMLTKVSGNVAQLEGILNNVRQAVDQVEMVRVMQASAGALKTLRKEVGGVEKVEEVVDGLKDEMMKVQEVDSAINELGQISPGDDLEVEEELEALEDASKVKVAWKEDAAQLRKLSTTDDRQGLQLSIPGGITSDSEMDLSNAVDQLNRISLDEDRLHSGETPARPERLDKENKDNVVAAT